MRMTHSVEARQQQTQRIDPRQILASEILAWTTAELEAAVDRELAENPALETRDGANVWGQNGISNLGDSESGGPSLTMITGGTRMGEATPVPERNPSINQPLSGDVWEEDPLERIANSRSLRDYLRDQVGQVASDTIADVTRYLIEWVDERGYLTADLAEVAEKFRVAPSCVEEAILALQSYGPLRSWRTRCTRMLANSGGLSGSKRVRRIPLQSEFCKRAGKTLSHTARSESLPDYEQILLRYVVPYAICDMLSRPTLARPFARNRLAKITRRKRRPLYDRILSTIEPRPDLAWKLHAIMRTL